MRKNPLWRGRAGYPETQTRRCTGVNSDWLKLKKRLGEIQGAFVEAGYKIWRVIKKKTEAKSKRPAVEL